MLGVMGGLPLLFLHIAILGTAFSYVGRGVAAGEPAKQRFMLWALGCALVAHVVSTISVSYFDQSFLFLYLTLAAIGSAHGATQAAAAAQAPTAAASSDRSRERWSSSRVAPRVSPKLKGNPTGHKRLGTAPTGACHGTTRIREGRFTR
jgi:hypothetical protein